MNVVDEYVAHMSKLDCLVCSIRVLSEIAVVIAVNLRSRNQSTMFMFMTETILFSYVCSSLLGQFWIVLQFIF